MSNNLFYFIYNFVFENLFLLTFLVIFKNKLLLIFYKKRIDAKPDYVKERIK